MITRLERFVQVLQNQVKRGMYLAWRHSSKDSHFTTKKTSRLEWKYCMTGSSFGLVHDSFGYSLSVVSSFFVKGTESIKMLIRTNIPFNMVNNNTSESFWVYIKGVWNVFIFYRHPIIPELSPVVITWHRIPASIYSKYWVNLTNSCINISTLLIIHSS